jgi:hypothetical protein
MVSKDNKRLRKEEEVEESTASIKKRKGRTTMTMVTMMATPYQPMTYHRSQTRRSLQRWK